MSGAGILAINPAAVWCQTSTTAGASGGELHKTIQPLSLKGNISRPLKFMEFYENKYWSNEHGCIGFRWWYVGSGILWFGTQSSRLQKPVVNRGMNFVHASRHSWNSIAGWRVVHVWPVHSSGPATPWTRNDVGITYKLCLTSSRPLMSCRIPLFSRVIYSVVNELLIVLLAS